jgi:hypothetical protein
VFTRFHIRDTSRYKLTLSAPPVDATGSTCSICTYYPAGTCKVTWFRIWILSHVFRGPGKGKRKINEEKETEMKNAGPSSRICMIGLRVVYTGWTDERGRIRGKRQMKLHRFIQLRARWSLNRSIQLRTNPFCFLPETSASNPLLDM